MTFRPAPGLTRLAGSGLTARTASRKRAMFACVCLWLPARTAKTPTSETIQSTCAIGIASSRGL